MKKCLMFTILSILLSLNSLFAADANLINKAKSICNEAAKYLDGGGKLEEFNKQNTKFVDGTLYAFIYECKGNDVILAAHPYLVGKLVGKSLSALKDKNGKFFALNLCRIVKDNPNGIWDNYYWLNPATKAIEEKFTYLKVVPSKKNLLVGVGVYKSELGDATLDVLNTQYK